jgi:RNA polymerase sigma factor (sigma-70 family)
MCPTQTIDNDLLSILEKLKPGIIGCAVSFGVRYQIIDDLVSVGVLEVVSKYNTSKLKANKSFAGYLYKAAKNKMLQEAYKENSNNNLNIELQNDRTVKIDYRTPLVIMTETETSMSIKTVLSSVPESYHNIFVDRFHHKRALEYIAKKHKIGFRKTKKIIDDILQQINIEINHKGGGK